PDGIVSALNRSIHPQGDPQLQHIIQTDAAINPGNSGGPLVNMNGNLVGINTAAVQTAENIGFSIPVDDAVPVIKQILANPAPKSPWLGVEVSPITSQLQIQFNLPSNVSGALVVGTFPGSPARQAGIKPGEVITRVGSTA